MALIKCIECGKEISDKANACPNCGCPVGIENKLDNNEIIQVAEEFVNNYENTILDKKENNRDYRVLSKEYPYYDNIYKAAFAFYFISKLKGLVISNPKDYRWKDIINYEWMEDNIDNIEKITKEDMKVLISAAPNFNNKNDQSTIDKIAQEVNSIFKSKDSYYRKRERAVQKHEKSVEESRNFISSLHKSRLDNQKKCPHCSSTSYRRISTTKKVVSTGVFGLASSTIGKTFECNKCGYKW